MVFHDLMSLQEVYIMLGFLLSLDLQIINDRKNTRDSLKELVYMAEEHVLWTYSAKRQPQKLVFCKWCVECGQI